MEQMNKQTETRNTQSGNNVAKRIVVVIFAVVEIILAFRLVFKLLGADPKNGFVQGIYNITRFFVGLFEGIFSKVTTSGIEVKAIFEPATLIAMVVVAIVAWVVLKLMTTRKGNSMKSTEYTTMPSRTSGTGDSTSSQTAATTQQQQQQEPPQVTQQTQEPTDTWTDNKPQK